MAINTKRPPLKESVGAQFICFDQMKSGDEYTKNYETDVEKTEVVDKISIQEESDSTTIYGSGKAYMTSNVISSCDITVDVIAFPNETLHKMRGSVVNANGLVQAGGSNPRPYFAYGKTVHLTGGKKRFDWYPKCQLVGNTDDAETKETGVKKQNDTLTIKAFPFDTEQGFIVNSVNTSDADIEGLTEDKFFAKPILTSEDLDAAIASVLAVTENQDQ